MRRSSATPTRSAGAHKSVTRASEAAGRAVPGRHRERTDHVAAVRPAVGRQGDDPGVAVLVERRRCRRRRRSSPVQLERRPRHGGPAGPVGRQLGVRRPGHLGRAGRRPRDVVPTARLERVAPDVGAPRRELAQDRRRHPDDLGRAAVPAHAERRGQRPAQMGVVDARGGASMRVQSPPVARAPPPVDAVDRVDDDHVGVQVRVEIPADPVREHRTGEARRGHDLAPTARRPPDGAQCVRLEVAQRPVHRLAVRRQHRPRRVLAAQGEHDARRLGRAEGQVVPGHPHRRRQRQRQPRPWVAPVEQRPERGGVHRC